MTILSLIFVAAMAAQGAGETAPATAQPATAASPAPPAKAAKPAKPDPAKKICVSEPQLGSHFSRRICGTAEEWEKRRELDAATMSKIGSDSGPNSSESR